MRKKGVWASISGKTNLLFNKKKNKSAAVKHVHIYVYVTNYFVYT